MNADWLFPGRCVFCGKRVSSGLRVCPDCLRLRVGGADGIRVWDGGFACVTAVRYSDSSAALHRFKFEGRTSCAPVFGLLMVRAWRMRAPFSADAVTWVPAGTLRRFFRGYDQSRLLAKTVAQSLGLPLVKTLVKIRENPRQSQRKDDASRRTNVRGVYRGLPGRGRVILVDDILTSGATMREAARALESAGYEPAGLCFADARPALRRG